MQRNGFFLKGRLLHLPVYHLIFPLHPVYGKAGNTGRQCIHQVAAYTGSILNSLADGTKKRICLHRIPELRELRNKRQKLDFSVIFSASDRGKLFRPPYHIKD